MGDGGATDRPSLLRLETAGVVLARDRLVPFQAMRTPCTPNPTAPLPTNHAALAVPVTTKLVTLRGRSLGTMGFGSGGGDLGGFGMSRFFETSHNLGRRQGLVYGFLGLLDTLWHGTCLVDPQSDRRHGGLEDVANSVGCVDSLVGEGRNVLGSRYSGIQNGVGSVQCGLGSLDRVDW